MIESRFGSDERIRTACALSWGRSDSLQVGTWISTNAEHTCCDGDLVETGRLSYGPHVQSSNEWVQGAKELGQEVM